MTLSPITDSRQCKAAYNALENCLEAGAIKVQKTVGWPHGNRKLPLYWRDKEEFWCSFGNGESGAYWCPLGTMNPFEHNSVNITCQISIPTEGINRKYGGVFLTDGSMGFSLAHSGKVGGGREGIGKKAFLENYGGKRQEIKWSDGVISEVVVLGKIGGKTYLQNLADYLQAVDLFKEGVTRQVPATIEKRNPGLSFTPEFAGAKKKYKFSNAIEGQCSHGTVVESLCAEIKSAGLKGYNNKSIDLFLTDKKANITHVFEVKTDPCTTSIYQAVGQVMLHGALVKQEPHRILVLPGKVSADTGAGLKRLGIRVVSYLWKGEKPVFEDLKSALKA